MYVDEDEKLLFMDFSRRVQGSVGIEGGRRGFQVVNVVFGLGGRIRVKIQFLQWFFEGMIVNDIYYKIIFF